MLRENKSRAVGSALLLGIIGLITNITSYVISPDYYLPYGNIFLFWSAGALGAGGGAIAAGVSVIPESLVTGEYINAMRVLLLTTAIGHIARSHPKIPSFLVTLTLWVVVFAPAYLLIGGELGAGAMMFSGLSEIFLTVASGLLLLSPTIWACIAFKPRHSDPESLLIHVMVLFSSGLMLLFMSIHRVALTSPVISHFHSTGVALVGLLAVGVVAIPTLAGLWLSQFIKQQMSTSLSLTRGGASTNTAILRSSWSDAEGNVDATDQSTPWLENQPAGVEWDDVRNEGVCVLTAGGMVSYVNEGFEELFGVTRHVAVGEPLEALNLPQEIVAELLALVEATVENGPQKREIKMNQLPMQLRFFEVNAEVAEKSTAENTRSSSVTLSIHEITNRRTVENHLLQAQKMNSLSNVVSGLAHTFNNALTTIVGLASYAQVSESTKEMQRSFTQIIKSAREASDLVWKLLDYCEGRPDLVKKINLTEFLANSLELLQKICGDHHEIWYSGPDHNVGIMCDPMLVQQVITNIVINAKESYREDDGKIMISLDTETFNDDATRLFVGCRPGQYARIKIQDEGCGMSPDVLSQAFKPLFTTRGKNGQTGLGLSIVFAVIRAHDGFLTAESHPDKGTTISLYLPLVELAQSEIDTGKAGSNSRRDEIPSTEKHERILVVEDEPAIRQVVARMLETLGYRVESCTNGLEALDCCSRDPFDLVLVDMMMPKMDGIEFLKKLNERSEPVKTLLMTGYGITPKALESGTDILSKPFDIQTLAARVQTVLVEEESSELQSQVV